MVLERSSYDDPLLRIAMQKNEPFAWGDLRKSPVTRLSRFSELGNVRTVLVCPIVSGPRQLGAIELVDPFDVRFRTNDIVSARRITDGYASFLASHGLVVDIANIARLRRDRWRAESVLHGADDVGERLSFAVECTTNRL